MTEPCLICLGTKAHEGQACRFCGGSGRVTVRHKDPDTVLLATGSCKMPVRKVVLNGGVSVQRQFSQVKA